MRRRAVRFMIYLVVTIAAVLLELIGGIQYKANSWLVIGLMMVSLMPLLWFVVSPFITPGWLKRVLANGARASAEILNDDLMEGTGYRGNDMWVEIPVKVIPTDEDPFRSQMKIRLSQAVFSKFSQGKQIKVRYDPNEKSRVVLDGSLFKNFEMRD
jgi:hypothetical protein